MQGQFSDLIRLKIIDSQSRALPTSTPRDVHVPQVRGKALAVIGMRRAGKTTFLWQLLAHRLAQGLPREQLLYFSFEDERLAGMQAQDLSLLVESYYALHPQLRAHSRVSLYLDEIQVVPGWELFARRLLDEENVELVLSGSSARLLSREVATSMRGRAMEALVHPFSFREWLRHQQREPQIAPARWNSAQRSAIHHTVQQYLRDGGFPETQDATVRDRMALLSGYVDTVLLRDVVERHHVTNPQALRWLVRRLLASPAGSFSVNTFVNDLRAQGLHVAKDTLHEYVAHLEDAFLVRPVYIATDSPRRRMTNPRKVYPIDMGLIPVFDRSGRANVGHALESAVLLELERCGAEVGYVRTPGGFEVDFLVRLPEGDQHLIQVCADLSAPATREREFRALLDAREEFPHAAAHVISLDLMPPRELPTGIQWHAAGAWLLGAQAALGAMKYPRPDD
jgi:predicted AAA+ superfamily ATPase